MLASLVRVTDDAMCVLLFVVCVGVVRDTPIVGLARSKLHTHLLFLFIIFYVLRQAVGYYFVRFGGSTLQVRSFHLIPSEPRARVPIEKVRTLESI